jgi:DNA polymerase-3 subunit epsilon
LNAELGRIDRENLEHHVPSIIDTLKMAKDMRPGQRNNLDALSRHYGIDNAHRTLHGALLDAELLADVYMAMTRGQESLMIDMLEAVGVEEEAGFDGIKKDLKVLFATPDELSAHDDYLKSLNKGDNLWQKLNTPNSDQ